MYRNPPELIAHRTVHVCPPNGFGRLIVNQIVWRSGGGFPVNIPEII